MRSSLLVYWRVCRERWPAGYSAHSSAVFDQPGGVRQGERHGVQGRESAESAASAGSLPEFILIIRPCGGWRPKQERHRVPGMGAQPGRGRVITRDNENIRLQIQ